MTSGGRNLIILGAASILVAVATTGVSLAIYHNSGDIYLDRSRPDYLPDEDESSDVVVEGNYTMEDSGPITTGILDEYLEAFRLEVSAVDAYVEPFSASTLSDEKLGI